jgi:hypothetical protein
MDKTLRGGEMSDKHPYTPTLSYLVQTINHFRNSFPVVTTADTLKKLGIAPNNESKVINILRFLSLIDNEGNKSDQAIKIFSLHVDTEFSQELGKQVASSYKELFDLHGEKAWTLDKDSLISFFRTADGSTSLVGKLQAQTFRMLAVISGHKEIPDSKANSMKSSSTPKKKQQKIKTSTSIKDSPPNQNPLETNRKFGNFGLTVRIEINLPADGDQDTYDHIFRSIRENLLNE